VAKFNAETASAAQLVARLSVNVEGLDHAKAGLGEDHPEVKQLIEEQAQVFAAMAKCPEQVLDEMTRLGGLWEDLMMNPDGTLSP
jgi:hypothetical protein